MCYLCDSQPGDLDPPPTPRQTLGAIALTTFIILINAITFTALILSAPLYLILTAN